MVAVKELAKQMSPSMIRSTVLGQHAHLRAWLARIERRATDVLGATGEVGALAGELRGLGAWLEDHLRFEEQWLFPALEEADAWAQVRLERLTHDHSEQRVHLRVMERLLQAPGDGRELAERVLTMIRSLRVDIDDEDEIALRDGILRDDVVAIGQSDG